MGASQRAIARFRGLVRFLFHRGERVPHGQRTAWTFTKSLGCVCFCEVSWAVTPLLSQAVPATKLAGQGVGPCEANVGNSSSLLKSIIVLAGDGSTIFGSLLACPVADTFSGLKLLRFAGRLRRVLDHERGTWLVQWLGHAGRKLVL